jgi:exopolysaccharide production protein ExoF
MERISLHAQNIRPYRLPLTGLAFVFFTCLAGWHPAHAETYKLVAEDKVKLRVVEWRSSDARYASWEALEGTYVIDNAGNLSIPIAGQVAANGKTTEQVADAIATAIAEKGSLPGKPFIALEVEEHAPVFVTGTVQNPGRYAFEPNMTVMKAVSVAGGFLRARDGSSVFERDRIEAAGAYRTAIMSRRDLLMRQARLRAEIAGETSFETPPEIAGTPDVESLKAEESNLMRLRRVQTDSQIAAADDLSRLYSQEAQSLEAKINSQKHQIDLAQKELDAVNSLVSKGLTSNTRQFSVDRGLAEVQSSLLDLEIALTKARQGLSEADRAKTSIINKQNAENQELLNTVDLAISKTAIDMQVAQLLGEQAGYDAQLAQVGSDAMSLGSDQKSFKIVRRDEKGIDHTLQADETTALMPHDLIEIGIDPNGLAPALPPKPQLSSGLLGMMTPSDATAARLDVSSNTEKGGSGE